MPKTILVTGASGAVGEMTAVALAKAGHRVYAAMHDISGPSAIGSKALSTIATTSSADLHVIELDVLSQSSVEAAVRSVISETGRIDALVHNSSYRLSGPAVAFTAEQLVQLYDMNVLSTQWVNRAVLPQMRKQGRGLVIWVSCISSAGSTPPYMAPYFAMANMDSVAEHYAEVLKTWGIDCCAVLPRTFGTNIREAMQEGGTTSVAHVIARIVGAPDGQRPSRVYVHSAQTGLERGRPVRDRRSDCIRLVEDATHPSNPVIPLAVFPHGERTA